MSELSPLKQAFVAIEKLQAKIERLEQERHEPIAVIGMGLRFPGDANTPDQFWSLLENGVDAIGETPSDRWDVEAFYNPDPDVPGKISTRWAGHIRDVDQFDPVFFGVAPREAVSMDPQQRLLLEVAWEALENAGVAADTLYNSRTGVFIGLATSDYIHVQLENLGLEGIDTYYASGVAHSVAAGRLSYLMGLKGPAVTLDTACSSSLIAVHLGVQNLRAKESNLVLAGGVNLILSPENGVALSKYHMMSADGRCKAFDASADGFVRAEGCGVVVLKRLTDALADGDRVLAVIRGSAANQDGPSTGLTAPNGPSQEDVIRNALVDGGIAPHEVGYIETHGTGTELGDPIEAQALGAVLGQGRPADQPVMIGSVKTNIGHLEASAGVAGLIKAILVLQHQTIPPHLHLKELSPHIPWERLPLTIPTEITPFPGINGKRIAGVSAFGFSGTNCHIVLEEAPVVAESSEAPVERTRHIVTLSAKSAEALRQRAGQLAELLPAHPEISLSDAAYTANAGRSQFNHRLAVTAGTSEEAADRLRAFVDGRDLPGIMNGVLATTDRPRIAFLFTGQGAQYVGMGRMLYETQPVFRAALDECDAILRPLLPQPLLSVIYPADGQDSPIDHTSYTQPALFALEYALAKLWQSWGIEPHAVLGHSVGEYVAACIAGVFSLEDGLRLIAERGRLMGNLPPGGAMAAAFADEATVAAVIAPLGDAAAIATLNGPENTVVSGTEEAVTAAVEALKNAGIKTRRLKVSHAFHSALMEPMLPEFERVLKGVQFKRPAMRLAANVTGKFESDMLTRPDYWLRHTRGAVRFADGIQALYDAGYRLFLEIGPSPTLIGMAQRIVPEGNWLGSLRENKDDWETLLTSAGALYTLGASPDWSAFDAGYGRRKVSLPTYPFQRQRYWVKKQPRHARSAAGTAVHPLLGERLRSPLQSIQFATTLTPEQFSFLNDHRIYETPVLPGTAYLEMAQAAAKAVLGSGYVEQIGIHDALVVRDGQSRAVQMIIQPQDTDRYTFELFSQGEGEADWQLHASGDLVRGQPLPGAHEDVALIQGRCPAEMTADDHYDRLFERGLHFGAGLHGVQHIWRQDGEALALIDQPESIAGEVAQYLSHPSLLDACLQTLAAAVPSDTAADEVFLPVGIERFIRYAPFPARFYGHALVEPGATAEIIKGVVWVLDEAGHILAEIQGIRLKRASESLLGRLGQAGINDWLYQVAWQPAPLAEPVRLASPETIHAHVAPLVDQLKAQYGQDHYARLSPQIDALCADYVLHAFNQLGWTPAVGEPVNVDVLARQLGVLPQHRLLLGRLCAMLEADGYLLSEGVVAREFRVDDAAALNQRAADLLEQFPAFSAELEFARRCGSELAGAITGTVDPLGLLFPDGSFALTDALYQKSPGAHTYNAVVQAAIKAALAELPAGHKLRILEVGAGTGGTTSFVLPTLPADRVESYTFTDISPLFTNRGAERFAAYPFMRYQPLNIEEDPLAQGFESGQVDLVIAANVIHATADLRGTLRHVRQLLKPGGTFMMLEMIRPERWVDLSFGLTDGWWRFVDHDVRDYVLITQQRWMELLHEVGFTETASIPAPEDGNLPEDAVIIARAGAAADWLIFADQGGVAEGLAVSLTQDGGHTILVTPGVAYTPTGDRVEINPSNPDDYRRLLREYPAGQVAYLWGMDAYLPSDAPLDVLRDTEHFVVGSALHLAQAMLESPARLWLLTQGGQAVGDEVIESAQASLWGLGKVIALEHPELAPVRLDLDPAGFDMAQVAAVLRSLDSEDQIALRDGQRFALRLTPCQPAEAPPEDHPVQLSITRRGVIDNLTFVPLARRQPGTGEVEIRVRATGLNFKDVLNVMGMYPGDAGLLGGECAGEITAVGPGVAGLQVGDPVMALASGSFSTYVTTDALLVLPKPGRLTFEEAATLLIPFITAYYCLHHLGAMQSGERVLIHAAAGGVGMAAVQLARRVGAEVFATAGSPEKWDFLRGMGVTHIMNSRTLDFVDEIQRIT
ncbi:MAG: polyketide synthase dehydratase domain-containing protein, partial [Anaerolineae bacterium]|nr:polyketide synthase dehydratase domain-containing protein [Anaerolineae bacterium]